MAEQRSKAVVRDQRHDKSTAEIAKAAPAKKNTKKWCKGKVGAEHKPACEPMNHHRNEAPNKSAFRVLVCSVCRKHLDYWMPIMKAERRNKPAWVTL